MKYRHISVAIPMLAELENLPELMETLKHQTFKNFTVYCCVNNPDGWWDDGDEQHQAMLLNNLASIEFLKHISLDSELDIVTLDRSTHGLGWSGKQKGVGWARKTLFDSICNSCGDDELVVSLDADTAFSTSYLECLIDTLNSYPDRNAICVPYRHPLSGDDDSDRAMLRYELYMRHYLINLLESNNPYAFTALGSAMAFPLWAYRRVGGITPLQGGEDFYLMQKFAKTGSLLLTCPEVVMPQGRPSVRVPFGTGPAIAKGLSYIDSTYPLYPHEAFQAVADTYALFPKLYTSDIETPVSDFLRRQLKTDDLWGPLRNNFKTRELFVHACQERVDGLRILQYLKTHTPRSPEEELLLFADIHDIDIPNGFDFKTAPVSLVNAVRNAFFDLEMTLRRR